MVFDAKKYAQELIDAAGAMSPEEKQAVEKFFSADAVSKRVAQEQTERMMQSDYNRNMDTLRTDKEKWTSFYNDMLVWKANEEKRLADITAHGSDPNNVDPNVRQQTVLTTEALTELDKKYDQRMQQQEQNFLTLLEGVGDIT